MNDQELKTPSPETKPSPTEIFSPIVTWLVDLRRDGSLKNQELAQTALFDAQQYRTCEELLNLTEGKLDTPTQQSLAALEKTITQRLQHNLSIHQREPAYTTTAVLVDKALLQFDAHNYGTVADAFTTIYEQVNKLESKP